MANSLVLQSQQVSYILSLTVINKTDDSIDLSILPIIHLTWLVMLLWRCQIFINQVSFEFLILKGRLLEQVNLYSKVLAILYNSVLWGLGYEK